MSTAQSPSRVKRVTSSKHDRVGAENDAPATVADLLARLGDVPAWRVRWQPIPGTAGEKDLIAVNEAVGKQALCELVDATLVEKPMGTDESELGVIISAAIYVFVRRKKLGIVLGADGMLRLLPGLVRAPDVSFISFDRLPDRKRSKAAILSVAPDLAVEILSKSNTKAEIARKLDEYFSAGTKLAWIVDPRKRNVRVHISAKESMVLGEDQTLEGGDVLPGFRLKLKELFERE